MGIDKEEQMNQILGCGFSYYCNELRFHSKWLKSGIYCGKNSKYKSDGTKVTSEKEKTLVEYIF